ncbi:unnamed protein product [Adineta ricciae]|uniref:G-protein coupled receptors family 1 profile domain-containing protein n=1 Tax=Adineta ricciae TaxID=249248 RepID=A0A813WP96_ADIRI|nr:unnamed protein product [Adineta ricciae]CAF1112643.1 unnamed protein product [Adineta ricciae]
MSFLADIQASLTRYGMSTYLVFGNFGNIINVFVFYRKEYRKNSCSRYLLIASFINIFIINYGMIPTLYSLDHPNPELYLLAFCKLRLYLLHSALMISRSLVVFACLDRCALSCTSLYIRSYCQVKVAVRVIACVIITWPIISLHIPILLTIQSGRCSTFGTYSFVYSIYSFLVAGTLPPILMIIFGLKTMRNLRLIHNRVRTNDDVTYVRIRRRDFSLMIMLLWEVIVYIFSTTPYPIQTLYLTVTSNLAKTTLRLQIESFITYMAYSFLIYINSASTFYVYFCTSRNFRKECRRLFQRKNERTSILTRNVPINRIANTIPHS